MNSNAKRLKLKRAAWMGLGMCIGTAIVRVAMAGSEGPDLAGAVFVGLIGFVIYLLIPMESKKEKEEE